MAVRRQTFRRKKRSSERRNSVRLSLALVALTAVNVYVFFFRDDTSVKKLMKPSSTGRAVAEAAKETPPAGLDGSDKLSAGANSAAAASVTAHPPRPGDLRINEGAIGENDTLGAVIEREGMGPASGNVLRALSRLHDPKSIRPGDRYAVTFDAEGTPISFEYRPSLILRYVITANPDGSWTGNKEEKPLTVRAEDATGVIVSSLYESISTAKETPALVGQLVDIFAWDINFYTDTHPGDRWKIIVEKHYLGDIFYRYGNILAAEYSGKVGTIRAFAWNSADGRGPVRYFDEKGQAIAKSFLKTPLRFVRISSKFDRKRFHPILHRTKAHLGVDYAAPTGTPIWAAASGKVVECVRKPGSGNTIVIQHGSGLATRYYHLHKFAPGMRSGRVVRQKELIGYVGTTGLSTGPHLHFSVTRNGAFIDPTKLAPEREAPVADRAAFLATVKQRMGILKLGPQLAAQ